MTRVECNLEAASYWPPQGSYHETRPATLIISFPRADSQPLASGLSLFCISLACCPISYFPLSTLLAKRHTCLYGILDLHMCPRSPFDGHVCMKQNGLYLYPSVGGCELIGRWWHAARSALSATSTRTFSLLLSPLRLQKAPCPQEFIDLGLVGPLPLRNSLQMMTLSLPMVRQ